MRYNERIREIREDNSMTQQKVADLLNIGQRTYADYESGKTRIPVDSLLILAHHYNEVMRNAYMGNKMAGIIPCMSIYEFLNALKEN